MKVFLRGPALAGLIFMAGIGRAQTLPPGFPVISGVDVTPVVTFDSNTGFFRYAYSVANSSASVGSLGSFDIDITTTSPGVPVSSNGLMNNPTAYLAMIAESNIDKLGASIIPVGLESQPDGWKATIGSEGEAAWFSDSPNPVEIRPGQSLSGFVLASRGLPGTRKVRVGASSDPLSFFPKGIDDAETEEEAEQIANRFSAAVELTGFSAITVGPVSPPSLTDPLKLLDFLISLKHQAAALGWFFGPGADGIVKSLDAKLDAAKDSAGRGNNAAAANQLGAFMNELDAQKGKHLNDNAYFLLKPNAQFIIGKLKP